MVQQIINRVRTCQIQGLNTEEKALEISRM
jgi:hypothetical protein